MERRASLPGFRQNRRNRAIAFFIASTGKTPIPPFCSLCPRTQPQS